jgi:DNA-binding MarR family transcriptional regulator
VVDEECERTIADLLGRISHELFSHSRRLVRRTGLTRPQLAAMLALQREGAVPTGVLAQRLSLSAPTLSGVLDRLEEKGLVERQRGDRDRRAVWVRPTPGADALGDTDQSLLGPGFSHRLARLSDAEKHQIVESLRRLTHLLGESTGPASEPMLDAVLVSEVSETDPLKETEP